MSLLAPFSLLFLFLAIPIVVMYMLKLHRREVRVSSTMLWNAVLRDRQANTPWQKLRRNLFLFLQLLILTCLILALARPAIAIPSVSSGSIVVILDASASMKASDVDPTRFEAGREVVEHLIDSLSDNGRMTLIQASMPPKVLASSEIDRGKLHQALQSAAATNGEADWKTTFALAAGAAASGQTSQPSSIVIVSDGGLPEADLPPLPGEVNYIPVGKSGDNLAISALALREAGSSLELYTRISNFSDQPRQVLLSIHRDEALINAQTVDVPSNGQASISLKDLPLGEGVFKARLERVDSPGEQLDALPLDDTAFAVNQVQKNRRVLLISPGNFFLEQVFSAMPGVTAYRALPAASTEEGYSGGIQLPKELPGGEGSFDLYVLDGILPVAPDSNLPVLPEGNLLLINPPPTALFNVTGTFTDTQNIQVADHSLTQYVDWHEVHIAKARNVQLPAWAEMLVSNGAQPLVFAGETGGRRIAALTFDLRDSDLPLQIAFPILFANLVDYLAPLQSINPAGNILPGEGVNIISGPGVERIAIAAPSNKVYDLIPQESGLFFSGTDELGVYAVNFLKEKTQSVEYIPVNLFSENESDIQPAETIKVGRARIGATQQEKLGERELWPWFAISAFVLLILEWWIYQRRP
jgi:Ca-activated chloride channel family protein